ncbi:MAG: hypothetical protein LBQ28_03100 [Prevotellaceae bacterium]|jgi:hypothetical protein|nr:hypothetical protein [Prevotellaceae bacterium]
METKKTEKAEQLPFVVSKGVKECLNKLLNYFENTQQKYFSEVTLIGELIKMLCSINGKNVNLEAAIKVCDYEYENAMLYNKQALESLRDFEQYIIKNRGMFNINVEDTITHLITVTLDLNKAANGFHGSNFRDIVNLVNESASEK